MLPQIIYIILICIGTGVHAANDGKPREGNHSLLHYLTVTIITVIILYYGHFFDPILNKF